MSLIDKRLKSREQQVDADGHVYTIRRPTAAQMVRMAEGTRLDLVRECIVGWNLKHLDLYPGGDPVACEFDVVLWADWLDDHPDIWAPLADAIIASISAHREQLDAAVKN